MPLTINVGVARKLGQPGYSSIGASCHLEVELDNGLLDDPAALQTRIRQAYAACASAVRDELKRLSSHPATPPEPSREEAPERDGQDRAVSTRRRPVRPATPAQVQAIRAIARDHGADLTGLLREDHGVARPEELSAAQASKFIDTLKAVARV